MGQWLSTFLPTEEHVLWKIIHQLPKNPRSWKADILPMCLILCDSYPYSYNEIIITGKRLSAKSVSVGATHELKTYEVKGGLWFSS